MDWNINFISHDDFKEHVYNTILHYGKKLEAFDLAKFNSNIIDPVKMMFDKAVYAKNWETLIANEIFRQRDKSNTNEIGYFHQGLFKYIEGCYVPSNGQNGGWDIIYKAPEGYTLSEGEKVHTIYVELKNKHNTMNSASAGKTYIKMQNQLLKDDDCACFLVEVIARCSQNIIWQTSVDSQKVSHKRIRRVSIDKFYEIITGQTDAFFKICMALPQVLDEALLELEAGSDLQEDSVYTELKDRSKCFANLPDDLAMALSMYLLGFNNYGGFNSLTKPSSESVHR